MAENEETLPGAFAILSERRPKLPPEKRRPYDRARLVRAVDTWQQQCLSAWKHDTRMTNEVLQLGALLQDPKRLRAHLMRLEAYGPEGAWPPDIPLYNPEFFERFRSK